MNASHTAIAAALVALATLAVMTAHPNTIASLDEAGAQCCLLNI